MEQNITGMAVICRKPATVEDIEWVLERNRSNAEPFLIVGEVELSEWDFKEFCGDLLKIRDYLVKYKNEMRLTADGVWNMLAIYSKDSDFVVLVNSEGYGYARYVSVVRKREIFNG